jgi:hypothetical protein
MAIGWLTVLQSVPWTDVIRNAPKLADGAKKLWDNVAGKRPAPADAMPPTAVGGEAHSLAGLAARVTKLEATTSDFHTEMLASSELIKALADQNALLVARVESNRRHMLRLGVVTALALAAALVALWLATR